jgi:hypothetical protein
MSVNISNRTSTFLLVAMAALTLLALGNLRPAQAQHDQPSAAGCPHYTVVETQGHNLIVTNNHTNELYFYTIDQNAEVGSELKLRGRVDLKDVGKPIIKPVTHKAEP